MRLRFDFPPSLLPGPAVYTDPVRVIRADTADAVIPALREVEAAARGGLHAAGYVAYEAAPALDPAMTVRGDNAMALVLFGVFEEPELYGSDPDPVEGGGAHRDPGRHSATEREGRQDTGPALGDWALDTDRAAHAAAVRAIRKAIAEGRTYQVNLTTRLRGRLAGDPEALYHRLRRAQGGGYHAFLDLGRQVILSASPELFFRTRGREITTRPMKGTRPRGRWPEEDRRLAEELASSPKDRAENLMIVDLLRNDLGRVCAAGSIRVSELHEVERYRTVWQMTSTVSGTLRENTGLVDLFRALFPCGSVTGAPKISTMDLIARLETSSREVYCGAIGWVRPGGDAVFSVPIRTAWLNRDDGRLTYGTGGGVVWDSTPGAEYDELLAKTAVVRSPWPPFRLLETLAVDHGRTVRLDRHLRRMRASAERFDFPFPEPEIRQAAHDAAAGHATGRFRLRITLGPTGNVWTDVEPMTWAGAEQRGASPSLALPSSRTVVLARSPVDPRDPFLYHKTTNRAVYDHHLAAAPADVFDVLLWNRDLEATEFCRGNLIAELDGRLVTPPVSAGLLPGCLRDQLLTEGAVVEAALPLDELGRATRLWFINSARGWVPVRMQSPR